MTCKCVSELTAKLTDHFKEEAGDDVDVTCMGTAVLGDTCESKLFVPFRIKGSRPGYKSAKGKTTHMFFSYCPFCGVKYEASK